MTCLRKSDRNQLKGILYRIVVGVRGTNRYYTGPPTPRLEGMKAESGVGPWSKHSPWRKLAIRSHWHLRVTWGATHRSQPPRAQSREEENGDRLYKGRDERVQQVRIICAPFGYRLNFKDGVRETIILHKYSWCHWQMLAEDIWSDSVEYDFPRKWYSLTTLVSISWLQCCTIFL